jgi:single-strand DNA-binding protein
MALELEGVLLQKFDTQKVKDSFQKREFILETSESYPQKIKFELTQDKCSLLDNKKVGDQLKVSFNIRGSEWQGKYFTNLQAWRLEDGYSPKKKGDSSEDEDDSPTDYGDGDDLPF